MIALTAFFLGQKESGVEEPDFEQYELVDAELPFSVIQYEISNSAGGDNVQRMGDRNCRL